MLKKCFNLRYPIVLAPMAGVGTPELCAAVSQSGGLGSLPTGYLSLSEAKKNIRQTKAISNRPFVVNLFVPEPPLPFDAQEAQSMEEYLNTMRLPLGLAPVYIAELQAEDTDLDAWIDLMIQEQVAGVSFTFACLTPDQIRRLKAHQIFVMGTATCVAEAVQLKQAACDAVIAQGYEAGGHRGAFLYQQSDPLGTMALIPLLVDALEGLPVIAAGGISDARGILAAQALGAEAAQMGTVFVPAQESCASPMHKQSILNSQNRGTRLTKSVSGKQARALDSPWLDELEKLPSLPYPLQHHLTKDIRKKSADQDNESTAIFWSGQAAPLAKEGSADSIMRRLIREYETMRVAALHCS